MGRTLERMRTKMPSDPQKTYHVILRVKQQIRIRGRSINLIDHHNNVVENSGSVALAKFGSRCMARSWVDIINGQAGSKKKPKLFLVYKAGNVFESVSANISELGFGYPKDNPPIPEYYGDIDDTQCMWFLVKEKFKISLLDGLCLATNNRNLNDVLGECRTPLMLTYKAR